MSNARVRKVRRMTRFRAKRTRQRLAVVGSAALVLAVTEAISTASLNGVDLAAAAVTRAQSVADLLAQRSPGERTAAQLTKTKHKYSRVLAERGGPPPILPVPAANVLLPAAPATLIPEAFPPL